MVSLSKSNHAAGRSQPCKRRLRVGFVPLVDCAPLLVADELGWFHQAGLDVQLSRELGWASVRDKLAGGELDAAHALAPMVFLCTAKLGRPSSFTPLILSLQGNGITISRKLWEAGVRTAADLPRYQREKLTFGIVFPLSSHHLLLRQWLRDGEIDVARDVRFVVVPPAQMVPNLKAGHLDGFCAGEPWNQLAVETGVGWRVATSAALAPLHPEKILLCRDDAWWKAEDEMRALASVLLKACAYCANPAHAESIATLLAERRFLGVSRKVILPSLTQSESTDASVCNPIFFFGPDCNDPTPAHGANIAQELRRASLLTKSISTTTLNSLFRSDLFQHITRPDLRSTCYENEVTPA